MIKLLLFLNLFLLEPVVIDVKVRGMVCSFCAQGIEKNILNDSLARFEEEDPEWEKKSAKIFVKKKRLDNSNENIQKNLGKMARAGFSYDLSKKILDKI